MKQEIRERIEKIGKGEVPEGYRKTKAGIIPGDWVVSLIDSVAKRGTGHTPNKQFPSYYDGGIKWISLQDSNKLDNGLIFHTKVEISEEGLSNSSAVLHPKGSVLISRDAGVGKSAIMGTDMAVSQHFITWTCSNKLNNWYLYYYLQKRKGEFERIAVGSTIKTIGMPFFKKYQMSLPPVKEQEKIAEILSTWKKSIDLKEKLIEKKKEFKRGLMQELLTGEMRFPEFTDDWEEKKFIDILKFEQPSKYITNNIVDIDETLTPVLTANKSFILGSTFDKNGIYTETPVIIFDDFTIDNKYVDFPFKIKSSAIKILKTKKDNIDIKFVYELMKFVKFPLGGHKRYYISEYQFVKIKMPKHIEQLKIVGVSNDLDSELKILNKELNQLKEQKRGLMQLLLTGIVRVKVD